MHPDPQLLATPTELGIAEPELVIREATRLATAFRTRLTASNPTPRQQVNTYLYGQHIDAFLRESGIPPVTRKPIPTKGAFHELYHNPRQATLIIYAQGAAYQIVPQAHKNAKGHHSR